MASWYRRMRGEQGSLCELFSAPTLAEHFEHGERAVPFVEVHASEVVTEGLQGLDAAYTEEVLLSNTHVVVATVQPCPQTHEGCGVVGMGGVKEIDGNDMTGDTHDVRLPDGGEQGFTVKGQLNGLPVFVKCSAGSMGA